MTHYVSRAPAEVEFVVGPHLSFAVPAANAEEVSRRAWHCDNGRSVYAWLLEPGHFPRVLSLDAITPYRLVRA